MKKVEYPKWIYASGKRAIIVNSAEAHLLAGEGWYESPLEVPEDNEVPQPEAAAASNIALSALMTEMTAEIERQSQKFWLAPSKMAVGMIMALETEEELLEVLAMEEKRPKGPRPTVLAAINDQLDVIQKAAKPVQ